MNDGSSFRDLQVIVHGNQINNFLAVKSLNNHSAVEITGDIILTPQAQQPLELKATLIKILAAATNDFPIQNKNHRDEFLRDNAHLRT